jgi:hypothetical protein
MTVTITHVRNFKVFFLKTNYARSAILSISTSSVVQEQEITLNPLTVVPSSAYN